MLRTRLLASLRAVGAAALVIALFGLVAGPAHADDVDAISGSPSDGTGPDRRTSYNYELSPGQQINDYYIARNTGTTAQTVTVLATDAFNAEDGGYALLDSAEEAKDAGTWITFGDGAKTLKFDLAAGETRIINFVLDVPANAAPGDHPAGILISIQKGAGQVLIDRRVGTRLYVRVAGELQPILSISEISASYKQALNPFDGNAVVTATIKNTGNVALGADAVAGVQALFGIPVGSQQKQEMPELLPGGKRTISFEVAGIGQWGYLNTSLTLTPTASPDQVSKPAPLRTVARDAVLWVVPWWLVILLGVALVIAAILWIRRKRDEKAAVEWIEYTEADARRKALESQ